jgi:hypothetical protein
MMAQSGKRKPREVSKFDWWEKLRSNPVLLLILGSILTVLGSIAVYEYERPGPAPEQVMTAIPEKPHTYSLISGGRTVTGESTAPFERGDGYFARVEACERFGVEGIMNIVSCYLTVRPSVNLVISNSENFTEARYTDGTPAQICCMLFEDNSYAPIYRIKMPSGIERRTIQRGSEIRLTLNIPNADPNANLDAIMFSPGSGVAPVLFPVKDAIQDRAFFKASFIEAHKDDPRIQNIIAEGYRMKAEFKATEERNRGLTYQP